MDERLIENEGPVEADENLTRILAIIDAKTAAVQADSEASTVAGLVTDFNALLAKLKTAGLMAEE